MSSHDVTILVYFAIAVAILAIQLLGYSKRSRIPPLGDLLSSVMRTRPGRVGVVVGWAWFGLHFFAR